MDHTVLVSPEAAEALQQARRRSARIGDGWVFPSASDPQQPIERETLANLWRRLEKDSGIQRVRGRGWHSLRRKFATDWKHDTPLADICSLGGWRDHNTVVRCYMKADEATMRAALARRAARRAVGQ
jgi:integrase